MPRLVFLILTPAACLQACRLRCRARLDAHPTVRHCRDHRSARRRPAHTVSSATPQAAGGERRGLPILPLAATLAVQTLATMAWNLKRMFALCPSV